MPYHAFSFFFNDTPPTEIYTLSLHDALPISQEMTPYQQRDRKGNGGNNPQYRTAVGQWDCDDVLQILAGEAEASHLLSHLDRKSTRLNSSHPSISYAVFCLKKKNTRSMLKL